ncbi:hypothetical protein GCM10020229_41920 [Kitasatospora albolonga]
MELSAALRQRRRGATQHSSPEVSEMARQKSAAAATETPAPSEAAAAVDILVTRGQEALRGVRGLHPGAGRPHRQEGFAGRAGRAHPLAVMAVEETGRGVFEDKAVKNIFACEHVTIRWRT